MKLIGNAILIAALLFLPLAEAQKTLPLRGNRVVVYDTHGLATGGPVFLFLPGIYRGYSMDEKFLLLLKKQGIPFVVMHFAEHPDSVAATGAAPPDFSNMDAGTLAGEVTALAKALNLSQAVPVSLSYSSVALSRLDRKVFPLAVETAPIGKGTDALPDAIAAFYEYWDGWMKTTPFGEIWWRQMKETQLRMYWGPWVDRYSDRLSALRRPEYRERALQGYLALSAAAENFDLRRQNFESGPRRIFILGENEKPSRLKIQMEAISLYENATGHRNAAIVIPGAEHAIPVDQPEAYAEVLLRIRNAFQLF